MTDKNVGKLWREHHKLASNPNNTLSMAIIMLIHKLIEDRQTLYWHELAKLPGGTNPQEALRYALRDFGIDHREYGQRTSERLKGAMEC